jgi:hypothetical protein
MRRVSAVEDLLHALASSGVRYCHWKSNQGLEAALMGEGDLDLLVDERDVQSFERLLWEQGFLRMRNPPIKSFPGLVDFLGFDRETGELIHLHVHYRLVLGEQRVKNHHLPVERWLLANSREIAGVRVPSAEAELVLLYARAHLKSSPRACVRAAIGRSATPFPSGTWDEFTWLAEQVADEAVVAACVQSGLLQLTSGLEAFLRRFRSGRVTPVSVLRQKRSVLRQLRSYQRYPSIVAVGRKGWYRLRYAKPAQRLHPIGKKQLPDGGILVSIVGADGSGKSTLSDDLPAWLGWKLQTRTLYFGQPKRSKTLVALRRGKRLAARSSERAQSRDLRLMARTSARTAILLNGLQWVYVARVRKRRGREARSLARDGAVVFAERFPVPELWSMEVPMDGPRLPMDSSDLMTRGLAAFERRSYEALGAPDHELVLRAPLVTLRERKPDTPSGEHAAKAGAVLALDPRPGRTLLDADRPYNEVLLDAKRAVWRTLLVRRGGAPFPMGQTGSRSSATSRADADAESA